MHVCTILYIEVWKLAWISRDQPRGWATFNFLLISRSSSRSKRRHHQSFAVVCMQRSSWRACTSCFMAFFCRPFTGSARAEQLVPFPLLLQPTYRRRLFIKAAKSVHPRHGSLRQVFLQSLHAQDQRAIIPTEQLQATKNI